jgi:hypothetical protein
MWVYLANGGGGGGRAGRVGSAGASRGFSRFTGG